MRKPLPSISDYPPSRLTRPITRSVNEDTVHDFTPLMSMISKKKLGVREELRKFFDKVLKIANYSGIHENIRIAKNQLAALTYPEDLETPDEGQVTIHGAFPNSPTPKSDLESKEIILMPSMFDLEGLKTAAPEKFRQDIDDLFGEFYKDTNTKFSPHASIFENQITALRMEGDLKEYSLPQAPPPSPVSIEFKFDKPLASPRNPIGNSVQIRPIHEVTTPS
jgi:hypothetical protein